jgi:hypothetical protein
MDVFASGKALTPEVAGSITINLNGTAYQLEEGGYDALRVYLETAADRLQGNPDLEEIFSDIEGAIAEKFRALLMGHNSGIARRGPRFSHARASGHARHPGLVAREVTLAGILLGRVTPVAGAWRQ